MHFQLPEQLQMEVIKYDATRKKIAAEQKKETTRKKSPYPVGNVISLELIPTDIVSVADMQGAIDFINGHCAEQQSVRFTRPDTESGRNKIKAILYYTKHFWVAAWLPKTTEDGYWYGISIAFKDNKTARKQFTGQLFQSDRIGTAPLIKDISDMRLQSIGRTNWCVTTKYITQEYINKGYTRRYYYDVDSNHRIHSYRDRTRQHYRHVEEFDRELLSRIPTWIDSRYSTNAWTRTMPDGNSIKACLIASRFLSSTDKKDDFKHDVDNYISKFKSMSNFKYIPEDFWECKWLRKLVSKAVNDMTVAFDAACPIKGIIKPIVKPYAVLCSFLETTSEIYRLYPDLNRDLLVTRFDLLVETDFKTLSRPYVNAKTNFALDWLQTHVSPESFLNMLAKYHAESVAETVDYSESRCDFYRDDWTGRWNFHWNLFIDTYAMLNQVLCFNAGMTESGMEYRYKVLSNGEPLPKLDPMPRRWRMDEWHDHLMAETWKIRNPNEKLPQKLFPEPIKVLHKTTYENFETETKYTFLQPMDTHQLAQWGQAVRNCVGSANYSEGIRKYRHIIVLVMIDGKPRYTVQLRVDNGMMVVSQIADISNARLDDLERSNVQDAFKQALQLREKQLS